MQSNAWLMHWFTRFAAACVSQAEITSPWNVYAPPLVGPCLGVLRRAVLVQRRYPIRRQVDGVEVAAALRRRLREEGVDRRVLVDALRAVERVHVRPSGLPGKTIGSF